MNKPSSWWCATVGAMLVYTSAVLLSIPPPLLFFPRLWQWGFHPLPGEPAISWYGRLIYATVGGLAGAQVGRFMSRRPSWNLIGWAATTALLALAWHERHWFLGS